MDDSEFRSIGDEDMAFYDWNNDGKKDMQDDFIEYNIYKSSTGKSGNTSGNHSSGGMSTFWAVICTIGILLFIGWMIGLAEPKCAHSGCNNSPADGSSYCYLHKSSYSSGYKGNSNNNSNSSSSSGYGNSSQSGSNSTSTSSSTSTPSFTNKGNSNSSDCYKSNSSKSTYNSNKSDDPYNAKDYSDAEDFYDDNYDDFDGYEDAEDYYDEWGE